MARFPVTRVAIVVTLLGAMTATAEEQPAPAFDAASGFWQATLTSPRQAKPQVIRLLLPTKLEAGRQYPVVYILPVGGETSATPKWGDGIAEAKKADLANKLQVICVAPSFTGIPWFGDHATDPAVQQESFLIKDVLPWVEQHEPVRRDRDGRWLIGFSKSGWGAMTLLLRNPDVFGFAAAWDAPFMLDGSGKDWGPMGLSANMGTKENMQKYLPTTLAKEHATFLADRPRLLIAPGKHWLAQCRQYHELLDKQQVRHTWRDDLVLEHRWDSGWFVPMMNDLAAAATAPTVRK